MYFESSLISYVLSVFIDKYKNINKNFPIKIWARLALKIKIFLYYLAYDCILCCLVIMLLLLLFTTYKKGKTCVCMCAYNVTNNTSTNVIIFHQISSVVMKDLYNNGGIKVHIEKKGKSFSSFLSKNIVKLCLKCVCVCVCNCIKSIEYIVQ